MTKKKTTKESVAEETEVAAVLEEQVERDTATGCCGGTCSVHTPKRVIAYRDERFMFGFVSGLAISAMAGFILLLNVGVVGGGTKNTARVAAAPTVPTAQQESGAIPASELTPADVAIRDTDWMRGDADAPITIVEFSDIDCPFCKRFHGTMAEVMTQTNGQVNWIYRHAPLDGLHPMARTKAHAVECIADQADAETFWTALDALMMDEVTVTSEEDFYAFAVEMGADQTAFQTCMENGDFADKIQDELDESKRLGMEGTPFSVIVSGDTVIPIPGALPTDRVMALIQPLL